VELRSQLSIDPETNDVKADGDITRKLLFSSVIGNALEWYDFFLYGTAAALVFGKLFFPAGTDPLVGTLGAFAGFAIGFLARPFGGLVFSHIGDRYGRKGALVATLIIMGGATFLMGLLPTYAQIGIWAPVLLVVLRVLQGLAAGGEWGGAVLMLTESSPKGKVGYYSSFGQAGLSLGFLLSALAFYLAQKLPVEDFMSWGWRLPFLVSILIFFVGVYIRTKIPETKAFSEARAKGAAVAKMPALEVLRKYPRQVLTAMGLRVAENGASYIYVAFSLGYGKFIGAPADVMLLAMIASFVLQLPLILGFGALADRIGTKPIYLFGSISLMLIAFPFFFLIDTKDITYIFLAFVLANTISYAAMCATQPMLFSSFFGTTTRYSGLALGHEIAAVFSGGLSPLIATALLATYKSSIPVSIFLVVLGAITTATALTIKRPKVDLPLE
jgi:MHS family shikimate/dehydroshikimate transporter-like MFS transporter